MMNPDPIEIVNKFNDCINDQDIDKLARMMTDDHRFIDRDGKSYGPKTYMVDGWKNFFRSFPDYKNTFEKIRSKKDQVYVLGFAYWNEEEPYDPVIWRARIDRDLIAEWQILVDTPENRKRFAFNK
jgi:hypothetical protein